MTHALEGVQFRANFVSYNEDQYEEWKDVPVPCGTPQVFSFGTQFRIKPVTEYLVAGEENTISEKFASKSDAIAFISKLIETGTYGCIKVVDKTPDFHQTLFNRNVQYSIVGSGSWRSVVYLNPSSIPDRVTFRIRPDQHFQVIFTNSSPIDFDDIDTLCKYVDSKIRTGHYDFSVRGIKYGV